ncbi:hypothetical protein ACS0TY_034428 [Phlomoides rotata]
MAINEGGPMFIRSINCQGEYKDKFFISTLIKDVITEVGVSNVVQVITDNALVCKATEITLKGQLQSMVISERWSLYREDNVEKARIVKEKLLNDGWWDLVDYILHFTKPIYSMLRSCDTDKSCLHLVYEMWDAMIFEVKKVIFEHEKKSNFEESCFWNVVHKVLEDMWDFGDEDSIQDRSNLDPLKWWVAYGIGAPHLRSIVMRLLGQVSSSSCCERN